MTAFLRRPGAGIAAVFAASAFAASAFAAPAPAAQAPPSPRLLVREIVAGRGDSALRLPGPWWRAARADTRADAAYHRLAARAGILPLEGARLASDGPLRVLGLYRRAELVAAARRTLAAISAVADDTTRARFDRLFRPRGEWVVDLHDAALAHARSRLRSLDWASARRALTAAGWLPVNAGGRADSAEAVPLALYRLFALAASDSIGFAEVRSGLWRGDSASAVAVLALLDGYSQAVTWYRDAIGFLLTAPWVPGPGPRSLEARVADIWARDRPPSADSAPTLPDLRLQLFGYPQAVPRYGVPPALFARLVRGENPAGRDWLAREGAPALLRMLRDIPAGDTGFVLLQAPGEAFRLTTVARQGRESLNGFLEPADAVALDPGYLPLLAVATVVHEWQHLIFERRRLDRVAAAADDSNAIVTLPSADPYLAEGLAEWRTERVLAPLIERWPLLGLGEAEKRARLARTNPDDQHVLGYAMVRALSAALVDERQVVPLLLRHADRPGAVAREAAPEAAWRRYRGTRDRMVPAPSRRLLIPQVTLTVEEGAPAVLETRILVPRATGDRATGER